MSTATTLKPALANIAAVGKPTYPEPNTAKLAVRFLIFAIASLNDKVHLLSFIAYFDDLDVC